MAGPARPDRKARLEAALRENLKRRKTQARARAALDPQETKGTAAAAKKKPQ